MDQYWIRAPSNGIWDALKYFPLFFSIQNPIGSGKKEHNSNTRGKPRVTGQGLGV